MSGLFTRVPVARLIGTIQRFHFKDVRFFGFTIGDTFVGVARVRRMTEQDKAEAVVGGLAQEGEYTYVSAQDANGR